MGELRPSAAITSRARTREPSVSFTSASASRVNRPAVPVPGRNVTDGRLSRCATISRRSSQLGKFQPNG